jgi:predicted esterase
MSRSLTITLACFAAVAHAAPCTPVTKDTCGTDWTNSCLKCGTASAYDCELCCPGCSQVVKSGYKYCDCKAGPTPAPGPSPDTWDSYTIAGMDVTSVTGGKNQPYDKVVVMLHGGGGSGADWQYQYQQGWFGNMTGYKYVFPTSHIESHVWYISFKNGCGLKDDCAYNISSIADSADRVAQLIEHEKSQKGIDGDASKVFLAGFSEGAQLTSYMQLAKLDYALGGTIVMDGYPLPPLCDMPGADPAAAKKNATYYGDDMRFFIYWGGADPIFPATESLNAYHGIFTALGASDTITYEHTEPGMSHTLIETEFTQMKAFIEGKSM